MKDKITYLKKYIRESIEKKSNETDAEEAWGIDWEYNEEDIKYKHFFGDPHAHTSYSDGRGTPFEACERVRNNGLDFFIVADHSNQFDGVINNNYEYNSSLNEYVEKEGSSWYKTRLEFEEINRRYEDFLAIRAFEMSSSKWGHINVINSSTYVEAKEQMKDMGDFFNWVKAQRDVCVVINHPHKHFKLLPYDSELDRFIDLIEVANGCPPREYRRLERYYYKMLDMGWHLGAVNGQDNHRANWGDRDSLTVVVCEELEKGPFMSALRSRRTYSTETRSLRLTFKLMGHWMGSILELRAGERVSFEVEARDEEVPIKKLQLITRGGVVIREENFKNVKGAMWSPDIEVVRGEEWYVLKVVHRDGRWGITSPIFIKSK